ncbi:hypothetical protein, partial [Geobacillus thermoleovorans]|uniref:hypothetical protein n=1 Tax=Geobacillus thermoleovorans TaxID=33941 RepID=UPI003F582ED3
HVAMESTGVYWKPVFAFLEGYVDLTIFGSDKTGKASSPSRMLFAHRMDIMDMFKRCQIVVSVREKFRLDLFRRYVFENEETVMLVYCKIKMQRSAENLA